MQRENLALPDVMLVLDVEDVIRDATLSNSFASEGVNGWIGSPWTETIRGADGDDLRRMLADARRAGVCAFRNVNQRFPSGLELPIEYTAIRLGEQGNLVAIGKNLRAVAELQGRLVEAQQAMERDYWKLREVETRYRLLFNSSRDAVLLLNASDLGILELNPAAAEALGIAVQPPRTAPEQRFTDALLPEERELFEGMIRRIRERGRTPGILLRLGTQQAPWLVRASLVTSSQEPIYLVQLAPSAAVRPIRDTGEPVRVEDLVEGAPDGFVAVDHQGQILRANRAFLELIQVGSESAVLGESLGRWLGRPGAGLSVLLANLGRMGSVRLFATTLRGELGAEIEAEVSACGKVTREGGSIGIFIRDIGPRPVASGGGLEGFVESLCKRIGKTSLRKLLDDTVGVVERRYIEAALEMTGGNRTAAAELLGLSRQSLYVKLNRYGMEDDPKVALERAY
jgi:transcriptional regulator PpsR